ncbi:MAG: head GIN domain-containing protein [Flavisolibacter sp.]
MKRFFLIVSVSILLSSCQFFAGERVSGNGHITTRQKEVGSFNSVEVSGSVKVHIRQDATNSIKLETDENLMDYIEVFTEGNKLVIRTKQGYNIDPSKDIIAYVASPSYKDIDIAGACDIIGDGPITGNDELHMSVSGDGDITMQVSLPRLSTEISGSGSMKLSGQATDFNAHVSGSGDVKCFDLVTDNTSLHLSGSADAEVNANKQLNIESSGSSTIQYKGNANVNQSISGSGSVKKVGS